MFNTKPMCYISSYFSNVTPKHINTRPLLPASVVFFAKKTRSNQNLISYSSEFHRMFSQFPYLNCECWASGGLSSKLGGNPSGCVISPLRCFMPRVTYLMFITKKYHF